MRVLVALGAAVIAASAWASSAVADAPLYNWTGFYVGAVASGGLFTVEQEDYWCDVACNAPTLQDWDASIGAQAGHNWQNGNFVYGIVADISTGFENDNTVFCCGDDLYQFNAEWNWYATVRARAGAAVGNALVFATAGIAIVDVDYSAVGNSDVDLPFDCTSDEIDCASFSDTEVGFAGGVGIGYPLSDRLNLNFEYLFIGLPNERGIFDFEDLSTENDDSVTWTTSAHLARFSLVYQLN